MDNTETTEDQTPGIDLAIAAAGSQDLLAKGMGVTQQVISYWKAQGYVPPGRVLEMEQLTGVPRAKLIKPALAGLLLNTI